MGRNPSESEQLWSSAPQCCRLEREMGGTEQECPKDIDTVLTWTFIEWSFFLFTKSHLF